MRPTLLSTIKNVFSELIPFNKVIGARIESIKENCPSDRFDMRPELVGNYFRGTLHGGVISSILDATGGLTAFLGAQEKLENEDFESRIDQFAKLGTIDLRIDYLRPGLGRWFIATGHILRTGNKIAVARIELHNDKNELIAVGTGAYVIA